MTAWLMYALVVSGLLALGARTAEEALRWTGLPTRWPWLASMVGSVALPMLARAGVSGPVAVRVLPPLVVGSVPTAAAPGAGAGPGAVQIALSVWATASAVVVAWILVSSWRLLRERRRWRRAEVDGRDVWVSEAAGPAVVGWLRSEIVVPEWALGLADGQRELMLRHEEQHLRTGDPLVLLSGFLIAALLPWNPLTWWQLRRMRLAVERDCDGRVLAERTDVRDYGALLLEVGRRRSRPALPSTALGEPKTFLERRMEAMIERMQGRRMRRACAAGGVALVLVATAMCAEDPTSDGAAAAMRSPQAATTATEGNAARAVDPAVAENPTFTPFTKAPDLENRTEVAAALDRFYPPLLRNAGIGGTVNVWFFIDTNGRVAKTEIQKSSGHAPLDQAALEVAGTMQFTPALNGGTRVPVWVALPIVFQPAAGSAGAAKEPDPENRRRANQDAPAPIFFVDGVRQPSDWSGIRSLDANAIQKVEVIKGGAAERLFGASAAGGVIEITLKH